MGINKIENQEEKWYKMLQNDQMTDFVKTKNRPSLCHIISGTKFDRDKPIYFLPKEGYKKIELGLKKDPMGSESVRKCQ